MQIKYLPDGARITNVEFDTRLNLMDSAQVFHWKETPSGFSALCAGKVATISRLEDGLHISNCIPEDVDFWIRYMDLKRDYGYLKRDMQHLPKVVEALDLLPGLRVLNQPAWEVLIAFILSANNNVKRIRQLVHGISEQLGEAHEVDGCTLYAFPAPEVMAVTDEAVFRALGCGYRAPYLVKTAQMVRDGFNLERLQQMDYEEALKELVKLAGVGEKVADCVLLFGCRHADAFPVDVWVERMMRAWFAPDAKNKKQIKQTGREMFGKDAGIIQQHLFHCVRVGLMELL